MTIGKLSRRNFILSSLATVSVISLGVPTFNNDLLEYNGFTRIS